LSQIDKRAPAQEPPAGLMEAGPGTWLPLPPSDPIVGYLGAHYRPGAQGTQDWQAARFSKAVYLYRQAATGWTVVVKFYTPKTGPSAERHAAYELEQIQKVRALGLASGPARAVGPLGAWRGVLFLEHVEGLTLAEAIAVRRSRPGMLLPGLARTAGLLARLHAAGRQPGISPNFERAALGAVKYISQLETRGVLREAPGLGDRLRYLVAEWAARPAMGQFTPALVHGDATTTNFILTMEGELVAIDWERLEAADPAADLGRLAAELAHSVDQQGGSRDEAAGLLDHALDAYDQLAPLDVEFEAIHRRARFYRASSTLRIARNGWLPRSERMALVAQAATMLDGC
jgi:hypothetical protein